MAERVQCEICLEECQKDELEVHREMCLARLMFQCIICHEYYVSMEGLWNHLDLHEISDEIKNLHYQEMRATYKLHQCALCNDQRGYQENLYWKHVHEEHDGFFLRCSECGECFRSQKLKTDHDLTHCKAKKQTAASAPEVDQKFNNIVFPVEVENKASLISCGEMNENTAIKLEQSQGELINVPRPLFEIPSVGTSDTNKAFSCEFCGHKLKTLASLNVHIRQVHHIERNLRNIKIDLLSHKNQQEQTQAEQISLKMEPKEEETTLLQHDGFEIVMLNQSIKTEFGEYSKDQKSEHSDLPSVDFCSQKEEFAYTSSDQDILDTQMNEHSSADSNIVDDINNMAEKQSEVNDAGKNLQPLVENPLKGTSEAKSFHCNDMDQKPHPCDDVNLLQADNLALMMEIKVEETTLQEKKFQEPNEERANQRRGRKHKTAHNKLLECKLCPKTFGDSYGLQQHMYHAHPPSELPCGKCDLKFSNYSKRYNHMRKAHTEPIHKCSHCPKMFYTKSNLNQHETTHSKILERNVACELCPSTFTDIYKLRKHVYYTHPSSESPCSMCDLKFSNRQKLCNHMMLKHKPRFKCPECDMTFLVQSRALKHMDVHSKAKERLQSLDGSKRRGLEAKPAKLPSDDSTRADQTSLVK